MESAANTLSREPWNKGKIVGQKAPFKVKDIWALRVRLQMENRVRELALFNLGIDSKPALAYACTPESAFSGLLPWFVGFPLWARHCHPSCPSE